MIRKANEEDYLMLQEIWESAVLATHYFLQKEDFDFYKSKLLTYFNYVSLYLYETNEGIKGFLGVSDQGIEMLFIHDNYRGQGIGKQLLIYATKELKKTEVEVNEANMQALNFYKHFGFKQIGRSDTDAEGKEYPLLLLSL